MIFLLDLFNYKPLLNIFENKFDSVRQCMKCNKKFEHIETFNLISLNVTSSIQDSFENFQEISLMDGKVQCSFCKTKEEFKKNYQINKLSNNLILHIRRFILNNKPSKNIQAEYIKDNSHINIPDILEIDNNKYDLRGFIVHLGRIGGGHYKFVGKNLVNKWNIYDDSRCYLLNTELKYLKSLAYILLYEKI